MDGHIESRRLSAILLAVFSLSATVCSDAADADSDGSGYAFSLPTADDKSIELTLETAAPVNVIFFVGTECPLVRLYGPRVQEIAAAFNQGENTRVRVIGVSSSQQDSLDDLKKFSADLGIRYPIGKDTGNVVADRYGAKRMSEVFVLDQFLQVNYRGRVDDEFQPGIARSEARSHELKDAITSVLAGKPVEISSTNPVGCIIGRVRTGPVTTEVTYTKDIAPVLAKQCVECHRAGEIGPFALTDYNEIVGWGAMMVETIDQNRMPPWHADPAHGQFANARFMPDDEKQLIRDWVNGGMPFGDADELESAAVATTQTEVSEWQVEGQPDIVAKMSTKPFTVPASGTVEYQYYVVDPGLKSDVWVKAAEVQPGNRSVVHHCIVFIRPPDGSDMRGIGMLTAYVPGQRAMPFADGHARRIPAGSQLVFQMHYTPTGAPQEDNTRVGLWLTEESQITHEVYTVTAINHDFEIPPHSGDHAVKAYRGGLPTGGLLLAAAPHMHLRGKAFKLDVERKGQPETLLNVPHYDFNWQHVYAFADPIPLADVDRLAIEARFDNSADNPTNPDPAAHVFWGDQTNEEMAIGFFEIAVPRDGDRPQRRSRSAGDKSLVKQDLDEQAGQFAKDYIARHDTDANGVLVREEMPLSVRRFGWNDLDLDRDGQISQTDLETAYRRRQSR